MGYEGYTIALETNPSSPLRSGNDLASFRRFAADIQSAWPTLRSDEAEISHLFPPKTEEQEVLFSETTEGLFQMFLRLDDTANGSISISIVFAYSNPRSVYKPVCALAEWLMTRYALYCYILPDLTPEQKAQAVSDEIYTPKRLCDVLIPSMDYNRRLWQMDAQTEEEAILRPGEAMERFMTPLYVKV